MLAYFEDESAGAEVAKLIADAHDADLPLLMGVVNVAEVWSIVAREVSEADADKAVDSLRRIGIEFVEVDWSLARMAGAFKAGNRMSFADCFAAALAKSRRAELVTGDKEFRQVEPELKIRWMT